MQKSNKVTIKRHSIFGNRTVVELSNGKIGIARCHPDDKFDVYEGLRIATARAYGKEPFESEISKPNDKIALKDFFDYKGGEIAIHPNNREETDALLEAFDSMGKTWCDGKPYSTKRIKAASNGDFDYIYFNNGYFGLYSAHKENETARIYEFTDVILPKINKHAFKVGERVQFKSWDELINDFSVKFVGVGGGTPYIDCGDANFFISMVPLCGTYATIKKIYNNKKTSAVDLCEFSCRNSETFSRCAFSLGMLKQIDRTKKKQK